MPNSPTVELPALPGQSGALRMPGGDLHPSLPLRGITILAVEDSRFASEALRLVCQRLGARLRRADSLRAARSHLRLYRPDIVIVDLGLPDGRGETLIAEVAQGRHAPLLLGTSGDPQGRASALAAGADAFLDKPLESLAAFRDLLTHHLPDRPLPTPMTEAPLHPDRLALRDDFARAAAMMETGMSEGQRSYLTGFLAGVAAHARDQDLVAALEAPAPPGQRLARVKPLLDRLLAMPSPAFAPGSGA